MITIRDIAKRAGVSASTASRALNDNPRISAETIKKVKKIAKSMGYLPDFNAKNLTSGEANAVGVVFPVGTDDGNSNPFYINVLSGINSELIKRKYSLSVAIANDEHDLLENVKSMVLQSKVKRFILLYSKKNDLVGDFLRVNNLRFVVIGQPTEAHDYYIDNNNIDAGISATDFLINNKNSKHPIFVASKDNWTYEQQRFQGYKKIINEQLIPLKEFQMESDESEKIKQFIYDNPMIDGAVATDDFLALRFMMYFGEVYPKKNISLIGFNNSIPSTLTGKDFHSIDLFPEQMGSKSVILLFSDLENSAINVKHHLIVSHKVI